MEKIIFQVLIVLSGYLVDAQTIPNIEKFGSLCNIITSYDIGMARRSTFDKAWNMTLRN